MFKSFPRLLMLFIIFQVANFHSFPSNFCFPDHISLRQQ
ncbi:DNA methyl transferase4 [Zea mays]|uniref:DNA methyl transferase4 n=1 Tax=Zea mays TaxID=4577 RepID=A0A1D6FZ01_MAIZE|nr:DNA methyl transferase4 [Zea mays]